MDRVLTVIEKVLVGSFLLFSTLLTFVLVVLRYGFGKGITWGSETVVILVVWSAFFGAGIAIREKSHIELEVVRDRFPPRFRLPIMVLADGFCLGISLFILFFGIKMVRFLYQSGGINVATELPDWFVFLCAPLGGLTMSIRYFQWFRKHLDQMLAYFRTPTS
jgi:TRAP-type C4-dicarboxylate transport system permease small subunit